MLSRSLRRNFYPNLYVLLGVPIKWGNESLLPCAPLVACISKQILSVNKHTPNTQNNAEHKQNG